jgi:hypothetical protein
VIGEAVCTASVVVGLYKPLCARDWNIKGFANEDSREKKVMKKESTLPNTEKESTLPNLEKESTLPNMEKGSTLPNVERIKLYFKEYDGLNKETDWRLQIAYAGPTAYISALFIAIGLAINTIRDLLNSANSNLANSNVSVEGGVLAIAFVIGNAMFIGVFVGNHYIEKKIELYMLELRKKMFDIAGEDFYGWISYFHGSEKFVSKLDVFAGAGVGIFQYGIPIISSGLALYIVPTLTPLKDFIVYLYVFAILALVCAVLALLALVRITLQVKKQSTLFSQRLKGM